MATKPSEMTKAEIEVEMQRLDKEFNERGDHGGSPGEWIYERMGELAFALKRGDFKP